MSVCDETCRGCIYQGSSGYARTCDHLLITGKPRGCPAGAGCTKRFTGKKRPSLGEKIFQLPPGAGQILSLPPGPVVELRPREEREKRIYRDPDLAGLDYEEKQKIYKARSEAKSKERLAGRQRAALLAYKTAAQLTNERFALIIGISKATLCKWMDESRSADWERLAHLGIRRPEGI